MNDEEVIKYADEHGLSLEEAKLKLMQIERSKTLELEDCGDKIYFYNGWFYQQRC